VPDGLFGRQPAVLRLRGLCGDAPGCAVTRTRELRALGGLARVCGWLVIPFGLVNSGPSSTNRKRTRQVAFIAAPVDTDLNHLRSAISDRGLTSVTRDELPLSIPTRISSPVEAVRRSEIVIGIVGWDPDPIVTFHLGIAVGLGKPVVVFATSGREVKSLLGETAEIVFASPTQMPAVEFALDQMLEVARASKRPLAHPMGHARVEPVVAEATAVGLKPTVSVAKELGRDVDRLLDELNRIESERDLASLMRRALEGLGLTFAEQPTDEDQRRGADFAIWDAGLEPQVRNPVLVEIKLPRHAGWEMGVADQVASYMEKTSSDLGVVVFKGASPVRHRPNLGRLGTVIFLEFTELLSRLRKESFAEILLSARRSALTEPL
jgi:hypothetical protein